MFVRRDRQHKVLDAVTARETALIDAAGIDALGQFGEPSLQIVPPPNPIRQLDNQLTTAQANGRDLYMDDHAITDTIVECNGCHVRQDQGMVSVAPPRANPPLVHGRKGLFTPAYAGATATAPFPGTVNTITPDAGDTMARARSRAGNSCIDPTSMIENCGRLSVTPSANVIYNEIWRPQKLHSRIEAIVKSSRGEPLGSLVQRDSRSHLVFSVRLVRRWA